MALRAAGGIKTPWLPTKMALATTPPPRSHADRTGAVTRPGATRKETVGRVNMNSGPAKPLAVIEHETVHAVIKAYAAGKIELPAVGAKARTSNICNAPSVVSSDVPSGEGAHSYIE